MRVLLGSPSHPNQYRSRHLRDLIRLISCTLPLLSHPFQHPLYPEFFPIPYLYPFISTSSSIPAHSLLPSNSSPRHLPLAQYQPTLSVSSPKRECGSEVVSGNEQGWEPISGIPETSVDEGQRGKLRRKDWLLHLNRWSHRSSSTR